MFETHAPLLVLSFSFFPPSSSFHFLHFFFCSKGGNGKSKLYLRSVCVNTLPSSGLLPIPFLLYSLSTRASGSDLYPPALPTACLAPPFLSPTWTITRTTPSPSCLASSVSFNSLFALHPQASPFLLCLTWQTSGPALGCC